MSLTGTTRLKSFITHTGDFFSKISSAFLMGLIMTASLLIADAAEAKSNVTHSKLDNGLEVVVIPDHRAPVVTHMVWYKVGAADELPGRSGIAHFLEHLMFKGTKEVPPGEFSKIIARHGGQDNAFTSQDVTAYHQRVAKEHLPLVMKMEADRMVNLRLSEEDVLTERKVILEERRSRIDNDPAAILSEQMLAAFYLSHPYGIPVIGWEHEIETLSRQDAIDYYRRFYAPNNAILVVAGDVTAKDVLRLAKETFGKLSPSKTLGKRFRPSEPRHEAARRVVLKDARVGKTIIQRLYFTPNYLTAEAGEAEALDLLAKILADGTTSHLYKKLVVESKKAASAGGSYSGSSLDSGSFGLYAVVADKTSYQEVEAQLDAAIQDLLVYGVTEEQLARARKSHIADHIYEADSQSNLARRYGWGIAIGHSIEDIDGWPEQLKKVTVDDIVKVGKKYLQEKRSVTGLLLPVP